MKKDSKETKKDQEKKGLDDVLDLLFGDTINQVKLTTNRWKFNLYRLEEVATWVFTKMKFSGFQHGIKVIVEDYKKQIGAEAKYLFNLMPSFFHKIRNLDNQYFYLNLWFIGMPITAIMFGALAAQLIISAEKLRIWAHGNIFFVALSLYAIVQCVMSVPLLFEIDFVVVKYKTLRVLNLIVGNVFNVIWFVFAQKIVLPNWSHLEYLWKKELGDVQIFVNLALGSILLASAPNVLMNIVLTLKEVQFQYYTVATQSINLQDEDFNEALHTVFIDIWNPFWWAGQLFEATFDYDPWDLIFKNPVDERHFYLNMWTS